jgi:hypothetical protein
LLKCRIVMINGEVYKMLLRVVGSERGAGTALSSLATAAG